ncbi:hypothetical protein M422DRAFT_265624 [Sphaerobolus stellatus SS14]|uniref:Unplaced genomic scaffold SPHSTscaffold_150, whole genome shotgun sequence n=1 Tax=Sphaerobolus stellatus (strain SS14) TaxID=990650 RepID=A0A0C9TQY4_SPHS4|nr:hypothetical protein M422DRAFT_265624 [Sphaerobolus stellatus SS14]
MPKKPTPKKSKCDVHLESEEEEEEEDDKLQSCIYCMKKKIPCVLQNGKKTAWAVKEGSEKIAEAVRDLTKLKWR